MYFSAYDRPIKVSGMVVRNKEKNSRSELAVEFLKIKKNDLEKLDKDVYVKNLIERWDSEYI